MAATTSTFDKMLKEFYLDKIPELVNSQVKLNDHFAKRSGAELPTNGREVLYPIHVGRNVGVGAIAEGANLPTAGYQQYHEIKVPFRFNYGRIQLTAQAMKQSMTSKGAFRKAVDEEIQRSAKDVGRDKNRQLWGFGQGDLCHINGVSGAITTIVVDNPGGVTGSVNGNRFLKIGDILCEIDSTAFGEIITVLTVNEDGNSFTCDTTTGVADGAILVRAATAASTVIADTAYAKEVMGMLGHIDDGAYVGTYHSVVRGTYTGMKSHRVSAGGVLSLKMLQKAFDAAEQRGNGSIKTLWGHHSIRREYLNLLQSMRRYNDGRAMSPDGGFKGAALTADIEYAEIPFKVDRDAPYGIIFGVDDSQMFRYVLSEAEWADEDGKILLRVAGQDAYEARYRCFDNYCNDAPNTCFVISGIVLSEDPEIIQAV